MNIGFTGTRHGMTSNQKVTLNNFLKALPHNNYLVHQLGIDSLSFKGIFDHGDCIGSDDEAHDIAVLQNYYTVSHPPTNPKMRAWKPAHLVLDPLPYLDRNKAIVNVSKILIATPGEVQEQLRSGTWSTIRYARKQRKQILIIFPDGSIKKENEN